jgi:hypothetical protein
MGLKSHTSASRKRQTLAGFWGEGMGRGELGRREAYAEKD